VPPELVAQPGVTARAPAPPTSRVRVALRARAPLWAAALLVAVFAMFHGYAHGKEMPGAADAAAYAAGFVVATGLLHLAGILIGALGRFPWGGATVRGLGGAIAALGCAFLVLGGPG
jgi:urease accessory protein